MRRRLAGDRPPLLVVDDAQQLEEHSAAALLTLVTGHACRTLATVPSDAGASATPASWPRRPPGITTLTRPEREIARMAAQGLTDKEIAATLVVSVRTVETHLAAAYRKLDIRSRRELSDLLRG